MDEAHDATEDAEPSAEARSSATWRKGDRHPAQDDSPGTPRIALRPGTTLEGCYRIEEEIGRGGAGAVYRARHLTLGRSFAIKVVADASGMDPSAAQRLVLEARTASAIRHDNIVDVTHLGRGEAGLVFVVMELLCGEDLAARLERQREEGALPWLPDSETRAIVPQILAALDAAHGAGVVHRDLKPANVVLSDPAGTMVKLVDFGMSKLARRSDSLELTKTGQIIGTPLYMAPEQSRTPRAVDARADLYSVGVMLYEMLSGAVPFAATTVYECVLAHATEEPAPLADVRPDLPGEVCALVHQCLAKDRARRPASAQELGEAWARAWDVRAPAVAEAGSRVAPRGWGWIAAGALAVVAVVPWALGRSSVAAPAPATDRPQPVAALAPPAARPPGYAEVAADVSAHEGSEVSFECVVGESDGDRAFIAFVVEEGCSAARACVIRVSGAPVVPPEGHTVRVHARVEGSDRYRALGGDERTIPRLAADRVELLAAPPTPAIDEPAPPPAPRREPRNAPTRPAQTALDRPLVVADEI